MPRDRSEAEALSRLGDVIVRHRLTSGRTQEAVAEVAGLSVQFVRRVERGSGNPSYLSLLAIATALKVPLEQLVREAAR